MPVWSVIAARLRRYCDAQNWKSAVVQWNDGEDGGYKEVVLEISGDSVYSKLKYEAGASSTAPSAQHSTLPAALAVDCMQSEFCWLLLNVSHAPACVCRSTQGAELSLIHI